MTNGRYNMFKDLDFTPGIVIYNDFDINPKIPLRKQKFSLKEDMLQVNYGDLYLIDIGWGPEFNPNGKFKIKIIKNFDWAEPVYFKTTDNLNQLYKYLENCVEIVRNFLKNKELFESDS